MTNDVDAGYLVHTAIKAAWAGKIAILSIILSIIGIFTLAHDKTPVTIIITVSLILVACISIYVFTSTIYDLPFPEEKW